MNSKCRLSRRDFLKASGAGLGGLFLFGAVNDNVLMARTVRKLPLKKQIGEATSICPYCGVGCSLLMTVENGRMVHIEGDPDSPINEGTTIDLFLLDIKHQNLYFH